MLEMNEAISAATGPGVKIWMNWMLIVFAASLLFVWKHPPARWAAAAFIATMFLGVLIFKATSNPWLLGIGHLIAWTPLAVYLILKVVRAPAFKPASIYGVWVILLIATIIISLLLDVSDVFRVLTGTR